MKNKAKAVLNKARHAIAEVSHLPKRVKNKIEDSRFDYEVNREIGKTITLDVSDVFFIQFTGKELWRYDMVVRYLAIENYYGQNALGFDLYRKMQNARVEEGYSEQAEIRFKQLIASYENEGYDKESKIVVDKNLKLIDGSHRMALAIYHNQPTISALVINGERFVDYSIDWFMKVGFTDEEMDIILAKAIGLKAKMNKPLSCVIWNPAIDVADSIVKDLGYYGNVLSCKTYHFRPYEYKNIVRAIYAIDDIEKWKIEKKLEYMGENADTVDVVELSFDDPQYRIKGATGLPLSINGERTKQALRTRFQPYIKNYFFDIIMHIADNHMQSEYMWRVFDPGIDCRKAISILNKYQYVLTKVDVPYYPEDFPDHIPVGRDMDVICSKDDFPIIRSELLQLSIGYPDYEIVVRDFPDRLLLRFELSGKLIFLIDCCCAIKEVPDEFITLGLKLRKKTSKGYYILQPAFEALICKMAYEDNNKKEYHMEYYNVDKVFETFEEALDSHAGGIDRFLPEFDEYLRKTGIPLDSVCIVGSAVLDLIGIRENHDIDFIVSTKFDKDQKHYATKVTDSGNIEKVSVDWLNKSGSVIVSDDEIILNPIYHFNYKGHKITRLSLVALKKSLTRREKDLADLSTLLAYFDRSENYRGGVITIIV